MLPQTLQRSLSTTSVLLSEIFGNNNIVYLLSIQKITRIKYNKVFVAYGHVYSAWLISSEVGFFNNMKEKTQMFHWEKNLYKSFSIYVNKRNYLSPLSPVSPTQNICYKLRSETKLKRGTVSYLRKPGESYENILKSHSERELSPFVSKIPNLIYQDREHMAF